MYASEFVGTGLLVLIGLSIVIALWGEGAPLAGLPLAPPQRRLLNGALFGLTGALISISPVAKISGSHINPAVTFAFWLEGKLKWRDALGYAVAQLAGAALGAACLVAWGPIGSSDHYAMSVPKPGLSPWIAVGGEVACTFLLVTLIFVMVSHKATQKWTPWINPPLFAILTWLEAPLSGASANPARSFGPALIAHDWMGQWVYAVGPCLGAALAVAVLRLGVIGWHRPPEARVFHFHHRPHDPLLNLPPTELGT